MRTAFRVVAWVIAGAVMVQAAVMVFAIAGLFHYVSAGGVVSAESEPDAFPEGVGVAIHIMLANYLFPLLGLAIVAAAAFTKRTKAIWTGVILLVLILLEWYLGVAGYSAPFAGALHGINGLVIFGLALLAGMGMMTRERTTAARAGAETVQHEG